MSDDEKFVVVGGGFYGCCLALALRSLSKNVTLIERSKDFLSRASRVNQARIHTGFHYPRSFVTALRSKRLYKRFADDFPESVVDDFQMIYAIARRGSKVTADRFARTFTEMGAPVRDTGPLGSALFDPGFIEKSFYCTEWAFDFRSLRDVLVARLKDASIEIVHDEVKRVLEKGDGVVAELASGQNIDASYLFNVTYSQINSLLTASGLRKLPMKHEFTEIALVEPGDELRKYGITVMDGPYFSIMPYPSEGLYSFTHVRYTPHYSWTDDGKLSPYDLALNLPRKSRWRHMQADAVRYMPILESIKYKKSLYDVKTVLLQNERDDGRPILFHQHMDLNRMFSVMGGKIDNIYDLFEVLPAVKPEWSKLNMSYLFPERTNNRTEIYAV